MSSANIETAVIELVRSRWADANVRNVRVNNSFDQFSRGSLYVVSIIDANNRERENYVYVVGGKLTLFTDLNELAMGVGSHNGERQRPSIVEGRLPSTEIGAGNDRWAREPWDPVERD